MANLVKKYAKSKVSADQNWSDYKNTGSERSKNKAKLKYAESEGFAMQLQNPPTKNVTFNFSKTKNNNVLSNNAVTTKVKTYSNNNRKYKSKIKY